MLEDLSSESQCRDKEQVALALNAHAGGGANGGEGGGVESSRRHLALCSLAAPPLSPRIALPTHGRFLIALSLSPVQNQTNEMRQKRLMCHHTMQAI